MKADHNGEPGAMSLPICDCTAECGTDPDIDRGLCRPCESHVRYLATRRAHEQSRRLVTAALAGTKGDTVQLLRTDLEMINRALTHSRV